MSFFSRTRWLPIYIAVASSIAIYLFVQAFPILASTLHEYPYDGKVDWFAARGWWQGVNPFSPEQLRIIKLDGLGHPPTTPFWFLPLAHFDIQMMSFVLAEFVVLLLFIELLLIVTELKFPAPPVTATLLLGIVLTTPWMAYHLRMAQVSELIAFLYVIAWMLLRRGRDTYSGVALGLACTLKLFPGLLVLCLLLTRRFRAVVAAAAAYLLVNIVMLARFGLGAWPAFFRGNAIITEYWIGTQRNASIYGVVLRVLVPSCRGPRGSSLLGTSLALLISVALFLLFWRLSRRAWNFTNTIDLPFSIFSLLSYFCNPWVWEHYNAFLILPLLVACRALLRARSLGLSVAKLSSGIGIVILVLLTLYFLPLGYCADLRGRIWQGWRLHLLMHATEVATWLPVLLMMGLLGALLYWAERRGKTPNLV